MAESDTSFDSAGSLNQKRRNTSAGKEDRILVFAFFHGISNIFCMGSSIRSQLWEGLDAETTNVVLQYLLQREVGDEDPILVMAFTDEFETVLTRPLSLDRNSTELLSS